MKNIFKPLGLAAAVASVTAGYSGVSNAQLERAVGNLGDLAIIPYYTTQGDWVTGVHIINTTDYTQVVKLRLRRAPDSADALDFNLIMSPKDEWTGFIDDSSGRVVFKTDDNTCTAPALPNGEAIMPDIFAEGAEEGYIEVIGMGSPVDEDQPIAVAAEHDNDGVPADCAAVRSNFFANIMSDSGVISSDPSDNGVISNSITHQSVDAMDAFEGVVDCVSPGGTVFSGSDSYPDAAGVCRTDYVAADDGLKVSYFFRDATAGTEMGGNAIHIQGASFEAWMTNQETGLFSGDLFGFDYPDLDGGPFPTTRGLFNYLRQPDILGVAEVLNDWSIAAARNVSTDWVVTMPGQYLMLDYSVWSSVGFDPAACGVLDNPTTALDDGVAQCDFRDIPVEADLTLYDREEGEILPEEGDLVISPAPPGEINRLSFPNEVNVVEWTDGTTAPVLKSANNITVDASPLGDFGWASLSVSSATKGATTGSPPGPSPTANSNGNAVCQFWPTVAQATAAGETGGVDATPSSTMRQGPTAWNSDWGNNTVCVPARYQVPIVGFVAWQRSFPSNPSANYGRLIDHSFSSSSL